MFLSSFLSLFQISFFKKAENLFWGDSQLELGLWSVTNSEYLRKGQSLVLKIQIIIFLNTKHKLMVLCILILSS